MSSSLKQNVVAYAQSLGFERVGIAPATSLKKEGEALQAWLAQGYAGEMTYMANQPERRSDPEKLLPGAKSVIALAMGYYVSMGEGEPGSEGSNVAPSPSPLSHSDAKIARYAHGRDYHKVIEKRLAAFVRYVEALSPGVECRTFVDAGPLLERPFAQRAGLGFIGKNTLLITRGLGSWIFLAHVVTTLELPPDSPDTRSCGSCTLCIQACPTQAIRGPFELDARRCISYLTIELEGEIPESLRTQMGGWVFGCDVCQDVCPHNTRIPITTAFEKPERASSPLTLAELLKLDDEGFQKHYDGTPFKRTGRHGLVRNACIAAANLRRIDLLPTLERLHQEDPDPSVRMHAAWAMRQLISLDSSRASDANV